MIQKGGRGRICEEALGRDRIIRRAESRQSGEWLEISQSRVSCDTQYRGLELSSRAVNAAQKG
jgi:hypothetical protein